MLRLSFCFLGGLGLNAEVHLWRRGIFCWEDYRRRGDGIFGPARYERVLADMDDAEAALGRHDVRFFLRRFPPAARARIWPLLVNPVYLDVETTGLGQADVITTAALYDGRRVQAFVRGKNLENFAQAIPKTAVLVTYNGRRFDLPRLRRELTMRFGQPHLDLCPVLKAGGFGPGLKACERQLRVARPVMSDMTGENAARLWQMHLDGDAAALGQLLAYNREDVLVLERLLAAACNFSMQRCPVYRPIPISQQSREQLQ